MPILDISCSHASPLVIVHKKEGGIRMAVNYREVNQFLQTSANQLPYQDMLFQQLGGQLYYAKVDNRWGYHQFKLDQQSRRVTAIITPWGCVSLPILRFWNFDGSGRVSSQNGSSSIGRILSQ